MEDVTHGKADYAVLPIENSTAGIVADIYDLLMEYKLYIVGEQIIRVDHVLLGMPGCTDRGYQGSLLSSSGACPVQGISGGKPFLGKRRKWKHRKARPKRSGEVGGQRRGSYRKREAGEVFGLKVLAENICREKANSTRFYYCKQETGIRGKGREDQHLF